MHKPRMLIVYFFLLFISVIVIVFICTTFRMDQMNINKEGVSDFNTGWLFENHDGVNENITLPVHFLSGTEKNKIATISKALPTDLKNGMTLSFSTYHSTVQAFVENKLIYQFGLNNQFKFGKSPACTAWHFIDIPDGSQGKQITLKFSSPYAKYAGTFNSIIIGTKNASVNNMVMSFMPSMIISFLVLSFGVMLLLIFIIARKNLKQNLSLLYQALFAISISGSALAEIPVFQLIFNNVLVLGYIMYFSLMLCPIPYLLFVKSVYAKHHEKLYDIFCVGAAINFMVCTFLQVANILDFPETIEAIHFVLIASLLLSIFTVIENALKYKDCTAKPFLIGTAFMFVFYLIDMIRYYSGVYQDGALISRAGLLVFIAILAKDTVSQHFSMIELGMKARMLESLAYMDILTQKKNRNAFEKEMESLNVSDTGCEATIVTFDLNNLKDVNDNFGHKYGDQLIIAAADAIQETFNFCGDCFRIGGDEFVVIARNCNEDQLNACFDRLMRTLDDYNGSHSNKIEIAFGYAKHELNDGDLFQTLNRADKLMYKQKREMKMTDLKQTHENIST